MACALEENGRIAQLQLQREGEASILGNIYLGRVEKVMEGIGAVFVEIAPGKPCYLPLKEAQLALAASASGAGSPKGGERRIRPGDELLVQVSKEAIKSKTPRLTSCPDFPGRYLVFTAGRGGIGYSSKLTPEQKERVRRLLRREGDWSRDGLVVRTNAGEASDEEILGELNAMRERWRRLQETAPSRTCFSLLYETEPFYISFLRDVYRQGLEEVVTDLPEAFDRLREYLAGCQESGAEGLRLYEDKLLPLSRLHRLELTVEEALREKVWLKSGGFLMIQQTEALVAIDVNSGKYEGRRQAAEAYRRVNLEAAREIAWQLRLRNLSGIILIDFINMEDQESRRELLAELDALLRRDPVKTQVIDMTALQLVEVTRKKVRKSLEDSLKIKKNMV